MKHILVPVDFSNTSHNAYLYARELALTLGGKVEVIHIYSESFSTKEPFAIREGEGREEVIKDRLNDFVALHPRTEEDILTKIDVNTTVEKGMTVHKIIERSKDTDMIVIGATGSHDAVEKILGSVSSSVAQQAQCPVIVIPKGAHYRQYNHIMYASNFESADAFLLQRVVDFANLFRASVHFIHVNEKEDLLQEEVENLIFDQLFKDGEPSFSFNLASINSKSVLEGVQQYADENDIDLIVLVNRQRHFIENVMGMSLTKQLALHPTIPLMVYHVMEE